MRRALRIILLLSVAIDQISTIRCLSEDEIVAQLMRLIETTDTNTSLIHLHDAQTLFKPSAVGADNNPLASTLPFLAKLSRFSRKIVDVPRQLERLSSIVETFLERISEAFFSTVGMSVRGIAPGVVGFLDLTSRVILFPFRLAMSLLFAPFQHLQIPWHSFFNILLPFLVSNNVSRLQIVPSNQTGDEYSVQISSTKLARPLSSKIVSLLGPGDVNENLEESTASIEAPLRIFASIPGFMLKVRIYAKKLMATFASESSQGFWARVYQRFRYWYDTCQFYLQRLVELVAEMFVTKYLPDVGSNHTDSEISVIVRPATLAEIWATLLSGPLLATFPTFLIAGPLVAAAAIALGAIGIAVPTAISTAFAGDDYDDYNAREDVGNSANPDEFPFYYDYVDRAENPINLQRSTSSMNERSNQADANNKQVVRQVIFTSGSKRTFDHEWTPVENNFGFSSKSDDPSLGNSGKDRAYWSYDVPRGDPEPLATTFHPPFDSILFSDGQDKFNVTDSVRNWLGNSVFSSPSDFRHFSNRS